MADDWADGYDPTNPDGPEPKNMEREKGIDMLRDAMNEKYPQPGKSSYPPIDPIRTNLGPVGFMPAPPQVDPMPYSVPPNMHPDMEIRNNEGPFFASSDRGSQSHQSRDINDYLQTMLKPGATKTGSTWRTLSLMDSLQDPDHTPSGQLSYSHMSDARYFPVTPMGKEAGASDLDAYHRRYHPPNFPRDTKLGDDLSAQSDAIAVSNMPTYMQKDAAEQLAKDAVDSKMESEVVWEGKTAPTQADIDKVKANPTDGMYQMFEDQFGVEALNKAFPMDDDEAEKVPLPKPRPKSAPKRK